MTIREKQKRKKELFKDLDYFLTLYNEVAHRAPQVKKFYDMEINRIIEELKKIGK